MIRKILSLSGIALCMMTCASVAQAQSRSVYIVNVPFAFVVADQNMSPGEYEVRVTPGSVLANENFNIVSLRNRGGRDYKVVATGIAKPLASGTRPQLAFRHYGDRAFLGELRIPGRQIGVPSSKEQVQRELAKQKEERQFLTLFVQ